MEKSIVKKEELYVELYPITLALPEHGSSANTKVYRGFIGNKPFQLVYVCSSHETNTAAIEQFEKLLAETRNNIDTICNEKTKEAEHIFETLLAHINTTWAKQVESKYHGFIKTATLSLALCFENHICIADRGKVCAYVVANKGLRAHQAMSTIVDGVGSTPQHSATLFESSLCGPLIPNTRVLIASPSIKLVGGSGEIGNILQKPTTTMQEIAARIVKKIEHKISESAFFVIIDVKKNTDYLQNRATPVPPIHERTPLTLITILKKIGVWLRSTLFIIAHKATFKKTAPESVETPDISKWKKEEKRTPAQTMHHLLTQTKKILLRLLFGILIPLYTVLQRSFQKYLELPRIKQIIIGSLVGTGLLLIGTLFYNNHRSQIALEEKEIATLISTLKEQKNRLDTILPFQDGEKISAILTEVQTNINRLTQLGGETRSDAQTLLAEFATQQATLEKRIPVEEKFVLRIESEYPHHLHSQTNGYIIYNNQGELFKEQEKLPLSQSIIPTIERISGDESLLIHSEEKLFTYNLEKKSVTEVQIPLMESEKSALKIPYSSFIYTVSNDGEILKHTAALDGYGKAILWGKGEITDVQHVSIATAIYLASPTTVIKLFKGKQEVFNTKLIMPPLKNISQLFAHPTSARVHLCEAQHGRIVTLSQTGEVLAQYQTKPFDSCAIDDTNNTAYVIRTNEISSFSIIK